MRKLVVIATGQMIEGQPSTFAAQAPYTEESERYDVNRVIAEVVAELKSERT